MKPCRECKHNISEQAMSCPKCGTPYPAKDKWDGWGFEYKSPIAIFGLPLVHISFKYSPNRRPVVARGIISIGQFGVGLVNISQFGIGLISLGQFTIAGFAIAQFALAYSLVAQIGIYINSGYGQIVRSINEILSLF